MGVWSVLQRLRTLRNLCLTRHRFPMGPLLQAISMKMHSLSCVYVVIKCAVVTMTLFPRKAPMSSILPLSVLNLRLMITAIGLLEKCVLSDTALSSEINDAVEKLDPP